jgi:hypothetical protein
MVPKPELRIRLPDQLLIAFIVSRRVVVVAHSPGTLPGEKR